MLIRVNEPFKAGGKIYAILHLPIPRTVITSTIDPKNMLFLTANTDKEMKQLIKEWENHLKRFNSGEETLRKPPQWAKKEEEFWKDWVKVWEPKTYRRSKDGEIYRAIPPGYFKLFVNIHDRKSFFYMKKDEWDGYYVSYELLRYNDEISWREGRIFYHEIRLKILDLIPKKVIEKAIEKHMKTIKK